MCAGHGTKLANRLRDKGVYASDTDFADFENSGTCSMNYLKEKAFLNSLKILFSLVIGPFRLIPKPKPYYLY